MAYLLLVLLFQSLAIQWYSATALTLQHKIQQLAQLEKDLFRKTTLTKTCKYTYVHMTARGEWYMYNEYHMWIYL